MTIKDIAKISGYSVATVSRVLNNEKGVSEKTRLLVEKIVEENRYHPNNAAKGLAEGRTNTILFAYENIPENPFYAELIRGAIEGAKETHQILLPAVIGAGYIEEYFLSALERGQIDGVIVASSYSVESQNFAKRVAAKKQNLVLVNDPIGDMDVPRIYINNEQSGYQATAYLIASGHRLIAHIGGMTTSFSSYGRYAGYCRAMHEAGLSETEAYVINNNTCREDAYRAARKLMQMEKPPTAIFAANDIMAVGVYEAAEELGLRIPDELSVIGHDDISMATYLKPKLTTMHQPIFEMGMRSVNLMLRKIQGEWATGLNESVVVSATIKERESVKRLK